MMARFKHITVSVLLLVILHTVAAQNLKLEFDEYSIAQGLSHNQVLSIAQDKRGFMWFGTEDGLNRFDGYNFRNYRYSETDSTSLISNQIRTLLAQEDGSLLIGTNLGVCRYIPEKDNFLRYEINYTDNSKLHGNYVTSMQMRYDSSIWITYLGSGIDVIYPDSSYVLHFTMYRDDRYILHHDMLTALQFLPNGIILLGGKEGFQAINDKMEVLDDYRLINTFPWINQLPKSCTSLYLMEDNRTLWIGTESSGLYKVDLITNRMEQFNSNNSELDSDNILCIYQTSDKLWIGSTACFYYDKNQNQVKWYNKKGMYVKNGINAFYEDNSKNLWMGTTRVGIRKINYGESDINYFNSTQGEGSIKSDEVLAFHEDYKKNIWVSLGGYGLFQFQKKDDDYTFIESPINKKLTSRSVKTIYEDDNHDFWLGTWEGGLTRYNPATSTVVNFNPQLKNFPSYHVWDIEAADDDQIWIATLRDGLCLFSKRTSQFTYFMHDENDTTSLINNDVLCLHKDKNKNLWIGTGNGLSLKFPGETKFKNFFSIGSPLMNGLISNVIHCIYEDRSGKIWLGTNGSGLIILKLNGHDIEIEKVIKGKDGLTNNLINSIIQATDGKVWVTTNNGLSILNEDTFEIDKLNDNQSFKGTEFLTNSSLLSSEGKLLLGSTRGFYELLPQHRKANQIQPPVYIIELKLLNEPVLVGDKYHVLSKPIELTSEITIPNNINYYSFEFVALNYSHTEKNLYAYKLDGFDQVWNAVGTNRTASFTNLNPGTYTLRVKASNNDNLWNDAGVSLRITILPPWYQTTWFRLVVFFSATGLVTLIIQLRTRSIRHTNKKLEELVTQRTSQLTETNYALQESKEEIASQNEELREKTEEIAMQRDFVENQNQEILIKSKQLEESRDKLLTQNKELEHLHEEKDGMINIIAHDLKSPLKQIQGLTDLIKMAGSVNQDQENYLTLVKSVVSHGSALINNLLELHGIENTNQNQALTPVNLSDFIPIWLQGHQSNLQAKKQIVKLDVEKTMGQLLINWDYLQRVLDNLVTNAMKFSFEGSTIYITVSRMDNYLKLSVRDEGQGISTEEQKELFKPFKKLSARPTGGESSSGLGLSIVKLLVEKMNGTLEVVSKLRKGSTFTINIPFNPVNPAT